MGEWGYTIFGLNAFQFELKTKILCLGTKKEGGYPIPKRRMGGFPFGFWLLSISGSKYHNECIGSYTYII
jgi:hypothetical protein